ncbi:integral membrane protein [Flavobacterium sp. 270]|nr:integral membrane protein [Flavobacterium sp. 270]
MPNFARINSKNTYMLKIFKVTAILEGISYLVLFANMLIIKTNNPELYHTLLRPLGMAHGVLFIGYIILAFLLRKPQNWDLKTFGIILIASLVPFGTFYIEKKYLETNA